MIKAYREAELDKRIEDNISRGMTENSRGVTRDEGKTMYWAKLETNWDKEK